MKRVRYALEYALIIPVYHLLARLPLGFSRTMLGRLAGWIGPLLPVHRVMTTNLRLAFPQMPPLERQRLAKAVWQHLGCVMAEHPKIATFDVRTVPAASPAMVTVEGLAHIRSVPFGTPILFVSGHIGNWELMPVLAAKAGVDFYSVYRQANNPYIEKHIQRFRGDTRRFIPKGAAGARQLVQALRSGQHIGMLVDQKMKEGLMVPFFNHPAATATACVDLAWRYNAVMIPTYAYRADDGRFRIIVEPPLTLPPKTEPQALEKALMLLNQRLEGWIRQHPEQWLWLHRRWPKTYY